MVVSWMTRVWTPSQVFYGLHPFSMHKLANGTSFKFIEGNVTRFTHKVTLRDLRPKMIYSKEAGFLLKKIINFLTSKCTMLEVLLEVIPQSFGLKHFRRDFG